MIESLMFLTIESWTLAYIDPGTGTAILYLLAALGTGILFRFRQLKEWAVAKFSKRSDSRRGL